jgi:hypothetical protein
MVHRPFRHVGGVNGAGGRTDVTGTVKERLDKERSRVVYFVDARRLARPTDFHEQRRDSSDGPGSQAKLASLSIEFLAIVTTRIRQRDDSRRLSGLADFNEK